MSNIKNHKRDLERKQNFIEQVYLLFLSSIPTQTKADSSKLIVVITHKYLNRYIRMSSLGKYMDFQICGNGDVLIDLKAEFHKGHKELLFEYVDDEEAQANFLCKLKEILSWLIRVFLDLGCFTYHTYLQYVDENGIITLAYEKMVTEYRQYYGQKRSNSPEEVEF